MPLVLITTRMDWSFHSVSICSTIKYVDIQLEMQKISEYGNGFLCTHIILTYMLSMNIIAEQTKSKNKNKKEVNNEGAKIEKLA